MITTRIATAAAMITFGLAGLGGTLVAVAAPAHAEGTSMTGTAVAAVQDAEAVTNELQGATRGPNVAAVPAPGSATTQQHVPFPHDAAPHSEHNGQGHKGSNEQHPNH